MKARIFSARTITDVQLKEVAHALDKGAVAVFPTDTVYGIGCSAFCPLAIEKIYALKQRPSAQPLQVLVPNIETARQVAEFSDEAERLARDFWPGALTLIVKPTKQGQSLARGSKGIGLRVPAYTMLLKILQNMKGPLCSTSANLHGQPVLVEEEKLTEIFATQVDFIIKGGTLSPVASSVVDVTDKWMPRLLREGSLSQMMLERTLRQTLVREKL